ncbi:MAG: ComEC/Rec2 family competence protein [candidate division WOR-3 bacterium]
MASSWQSMGMRHAAVRALSALAVGIACGHGLREWSWLAAVAIVAGIAAAPITRGLGGYLALAGAGALLLLSREPAAVPDAVYRARCFQGAVVEEPLGFRHNRIVVQLTEPPGCKVIVWLDESLDCIRYGDIVEVKARVSPFSFPRNPGIADRNTVWRRRGFIGTATAKSGQVRVVGHGHGCPLMRLVVMPVRRHIYRAARENVPGPGGALLPALMLGDRAGLSEQLQEAFAEGGVIHVLVVSGLHVGIIISGVWLLLTVLGVRGWLGFGLTSTAAGVYVLLAGASAASVRAGLMAIAALLSIPIQRRVSHLAGLCSAGIVLLVIDPNALFDVGAQLSFAATLAIVKVLPLHRRSWQVRQSSSFLRRWLTVPLIVSSAATLGTAPLLLHHFGLMQPLAPVTSLLVVPVVSLSLLAGMIVVAVSAVLPVLAGIMANSLALMLNWLLLIAEGLRWFRPVMWGPGAISWPAVFWLYTLGLLGVGWRVHWARRVFVAVLGLGLVFLVWRPVLRRPETRVTFLDPGRGDATLLEDTLGRRLLIDAGIDGTDVLRDFLRMRGIYRLDAVVVSHPDRDHYGGLLDLRPDVRIGQLLVPTVKGEDTGYESLLRRLTRRGTRIALAAAGTRLHGFGYDVEFTAPSSTARGLYEQGLLSSNMVSLVTRVTHGGLTMLFTGDMDSPDRLQSEPVWLLKSPHHGSRKGNPPQLYQVLQPKFVVTMGRFPTRARIEDWLAELGAADINTRRDGGIVLRFGRSGPVFRRN